MNSGVWITLYLRSGSLTVECLTCWYIFLTKHPYHTLHLKIQHVVAAWWLIIAGKVFLPSLTMAFFFPGESLWKYYLFSPPHNVTKDLLYGFIYSNKYLPHLNHKTLKIQWNRALNITDDVTVLSIIPETVLGSLRGLWIVLESLFWDRFLF